jgi:hypothetical protein
MNAFEQIVANLLNQEGFWTRIDYKVILTKEQKAKIDKPSMPRPEIDILAYKPCKNLLLWIECKSYINSGGVRMSSFININDPGYNRYKVFNYPVYRDEITSALRSQVISNGLCTNGLEIKHCLVAGKIYTTKDRTLLQDYFTLNNWILWDDEWIKEGLKKYAASDYEDDVAVLVSKLFSGIENK